MARTPGSNPDGDTAANPSPPPIPRASPATVPKSVRTTAATVPAESTTRPLSRAAPVAAPKNDEPCTGPGTPLRLGQIGAFSGVAGPIEAGARTTLATWATAINARGG